MRKIEYTEKLYYYLITYYEEDAKEAKTNTLISVRRLNKPKRYIQARFDKDKLSRTVIAADLYNVDVTKYHMDSETFKAYATKTKV